MKIADKFLYKIKQQDNKKSIIERFNTSEDSLVRNNDQIELYAGEWIEIGINDYITHIVKPAENLKKIADYYKVEINKIAEDNNLNNQPLYIGQILKIYNK